MQLTNDTLSSVLPRFNTTEATMIHVFNIISRAKGPIARNAVYKI